MSLLKIKNISKKFGNRQVVQSASFQIESGQIVGLLGPNGAGKTTSFYMAVGLLAPDSGRILLNDVEITKEPMHQRARIGLSYLPQEASVFRRLTVKENLLIALEAADLSQDDAHEKMKELLSEFSIEHIQNNYGYSLSGGERRRVEIARALAGKPHFILLDEPFAGIDPIAVADIQKIIKQLKTKGLGVLITDHNVRETLHICDFAYILKNGKIEVEGTPTDVANNKLARQFYLGENFSL